jgi:hypothetical protein
MNSALQSRISSMRALPYVSELPAKQKQIVLAAISAIEQRAKAGTTNRYYAERQMAIVNDCARILYGHSVLADVEFTKSARSAQDRMKKRTAKFFIASAIRAKFALLDEGGKDVLETGNMVLNAVSNALKRIIEPQAPGTPVLYDRKDPVKDTINREQGYFPFHDPMGEYTEYFRVLQKVPEYSATWADQHA